MQLKNYMKWHFVVKGRVLQASINIVYIIENNISVAVHQACEKAITNANALV